MNIEPELLNERLERLAIVLDELMPQCAELVRDALELLKKQEAVKPIITPWVENEDGEVILAKRECGRCGYQFFTVRPNFCEKCGTPILWEGK